MEHLLSSLDPASAAADGGSKGGIEAGGGLEGAGGRKGLPRIKLPSEIMHKLRHLSEKHPPQIRPSIRSVLINDLPVFTFEAIVFYLISFVPGLT